MCLVSIVTTMYRSESFLLEFHVRMRAAVEQVTSDFELIFVDDGSPDRSSDVVAGLAEHDRRVKLVQLSRNFGHHRAIIAGLEVSKGDFILSIDCDLEESPELFCDFYQFLVEHREHDSVFGYLEHRRGGWFERLSGAIYYKLLNLFSEIPIPENASQLRLMRRNLVQHLLEFGEYHLVFHCVYQLNGFRNHPTPIKKGYKGATTYSLRKKVSQAIDAITSFSLLPLYYMSACGVGISGLAVAAGLAHFIAKVRGESFDAGWISIVLSIWFLGGCILASLGLLGIYVGKTYIQSKGRPRFVVRKTINV